MGEGGLRSSSRESLLGCVTVKRPANWGTWISWENFSVFVCACPAFKYVSKGSLTASSTGIYMEPNSRLRNAFQARIFDSVLMSSEPGVKAGWTIKKTDFHRFSSYQRYQSYPIAMPHRQQGVITAMTTNLMIPLQSLNAWFLWSLQYIPVWGIWPFLWMCFYFPLYLFSLPSFSFDVSRMHCVNVDMRMHTQIFGKNWGKEDHFSPSMRCHQSLVAGV